jgi:signal peptidase I
VKAADLDAVSVARLRALAAAAAPSVAARPGLAEDVLRAARGRRGRRRRLLLGGLPALAAVAVAAAFALPGGGEYLTEFQPSAGMEPTVSQGETLIAGKHLTVERDDVVVARVEVPGGPGSVAADKLDLIRRVVGMPGDRVACPDDGTGHCATLIRNGVPVAEPYVTADQGRPFSEVRVPAGFVFLLGDNRALAVDSRIVGPVPMSAVRAVGVRVVAADGTQRPLPGAPERPASSPDDVVDGQQPPPDAKAATPGFDGGGGH